ncbi:hypothetical protein DL771_007962 [Monosporascus sp. 5C6A]|nr:hypothetical protein DL771_007962 [Monosporascus sp. 5C6A]
MAFYLGLRVDFSAPVELPSPCCRYWDDPYHQDDRGGEIQKAASISGLSGALLYLGASAQFPPKPKGVTVLRSKFHENVTISFKEPGICETTHGVKSYSDIHLPPGYLNDGEHGEVQDYPINTSAGLMARPNQPTAEAPLAIWLNGGPGDSSMMGRASGNGPCFVAENSATTYINPWS